MYFSKRKISRILFLGIPFKSNNLLKAQTLKVADFEKK